jgi:hypothetical protein
MRCFRPVSDIGFRDLATKHEKRKQAAPRYCVRTDTRGTRGVSFFPKCVGGIRRFNLAATHDMFILMKATGLYDKGYVVASCAVVV